MNETHRVGYAPIRSAHYSESEYPIIVHLAVAWSVPQQPNKTFARSERMT